LQIYGKETNFAAGTDVRIEVEIETPNECSEKITHSLDCLLVRN